MAEMIDLGECCACGKRGQSVRNIGFLRIKGPTPGKGWGCFVCGLPEDGAVVVMCDDCVATQQEPTHVCAGNPSEGGRVAIEGLTEPHVHDASKHTFVQTCRLCGCTEFDACIDAERGPCWWVDVDLCSHCVIQNPAVEAALDLEEEQ